MEEERENMNGDGDLKQLGWVENSIQSCLVEGKTSLTDFLLSQVSSTFNPDFPRCLFLTLQVLLKHLIKILPTPRNIF